MSSSRNSKEGKGRDSVSHRHSEEQYGEYEQDYGMADAPAHPSVPYGSGYYTK